MKNLIAIIANVAVFGWAGAHFGIWVCLPLAAVYFIGLFQGIE